MQYYLFYCKISSRYRYQAPIVDQTYNTDLNKGEYKHINTGKHIKIDNIAKINEIISTFELNFGLNNNLIPIGSVGNTKIMI